jgi:hypothetical protein
MERTGPLPDRIPDLPSGRVATPLAIFNKRSSLDNSGKDKESIESPMASMDHPSATPKKVSGILEVFCVDISRSMWFVIY